MVFIKIWYVDSYLIKNFQELIFRDISMDMDIGNDSCGFTAVATNIMDSIEMSTSF